MPSAISASSGRAWIYSTLTICVTAICITTPREHAENRRVTISLVADESYDVIVIGTSQGGRFLPVDLARAGKNVALVERGQLGGVCVNSGCTPTKTMVASARLAYLARRGAEYGVQTGPVSVDLAAVRERKRADGGGRERELREPPDSGRA